MKRLAVLLLLACGPVDVVVGDVPPMPCSAEGGCPDGNFCEHPRCGDNFGICRPVPTTCDVPPRDVCDCDGRHYRSECEREQARQSGGPC